MASTATKKSAQDRLLDFKYRRPLPGDSAAESTPVLLTRCSRVNQTRQYLVSVPGQPCSHVRQYKPYRSHLDIQVILDWLNFCKGRHKERCANPSSDSRVAGLKVVDCADRKVVPAPPDVEYVALSYLWGNSKNQEPTSGTAVDLNDLPVPQTVQDAISVVLQLGMRFLWIDRYCIDSSNAEEKHSMIGSMDTIYNGAALTVIAAAGTNPNHGLPGVSMPFKMYKFSLLRDGCRLYRLPNPRQELARSVWSRRGWTYQEGLLSRRRLLFTDHQVYFQCLNMHSVENWNARLEELHAETKNGYMFRQGVVLNECFPKDGLGAREGDIFRRIDEFSIKELSYASDSLQAFLGILRAFQKREKPVYHVWGLPIKGSLFNLIDGVPMRPDGDLARYLLWGSWMFYKPDGVFFGLTRVPEVPSFSWAGWRGFIHLGTPYVGFTQPYPASYPKREFLEDYEPSAGVHLVRNEDNRLLEVYDSVHRIGSLVSLDHYCKHCLAITGLTTEVQLSVGEDPMFRTRNDRVWRKISLAIDGAQDQQMMQRLASETWTALIILCRSEWTDEAAIGLLLEPAPQYGPDCYTRVGIFRAGWSARAFAQASDRSGTFNIGATVQLGGRVFKCRTIYLY